MILGNKDQYYIQTNDGSVFLLGNYGAQHRFIACGANAAVTCADIAGWPLDIWTRGAQSADILLMVLNNPFNNFNCSSPPNEVLMNYPPALKLVYNSDVCFLDTNVNYATIKSYIDKGMPVQVCGEFPCGAHFVAVVGYDGADTLIINDPYPPNYTDNNGYNKQWKWTDLKLIGTMIVYNKYKG